MSEQEYEQHLNTPACRVENYSYKHPFAERWALQGIDFELEPGEVLAVFGDSGSGKTTLFSSIGGFNHHFYRGGEHKGEIKLFGKDVSQADIFDLAGNYGMVSQDFRNQLLASQVADAVAFPLENKGVPYEDMHQRVEAMLEMMGLSGLRNREIAGLSGGEGQAVVIASMLAKDPRLMIFDDVASDLDPRGQAKIKAIISRLKEQGITMLIVDSSAPNWLVAEMADRVLVLEEGKQIFHGSPQELLNQPELVGKIGAVVPGIEFRETRHSPAAIIVENVSFAYDGNLAVNDVSCEIGKGSITGIIGHNGSGKTTLLKEVGGLYKPASGSIRVGGIVPSSMPAREIVREIVYMPQNTGGTFFTDSVTKELGYTPQAIGIESKVTADEVGLGALRDEHPESLSAGQRQRLAFGCALSSDPEVLLLDEPTKGLNQRERQELVDRLLSLQAGGKTIVVVSHDWPLIGRVTENVLVMDHGKLVNQGPTKEILQDRDFFEELGLPLPW